MPRQKTITLYTFKELSEKAQQRAIDRWIAQEQSSQDHSAWSEFVLEDAETIAGILGIELKYHEVRTMGGIARREPNFWWSLGYVQSDGAVFEGRYSYATGAHHKIRAHAPQDFVLHSIADRLLSVQRDYRYSLVATVTHDGRGYYPCIEVDRTLGPNEISGADVDTLRTALKDFCRWIYDQLREAYESHTSEEHAREVLEENDDEYDEHGSLER